MFSNVVNSYVIKKFRHTLSKKLRFPTLQTTKNMTYSELISFMQH